VEVSAEVKTPVALSPRISLPPRPTLKFHSSILKAVESPSFLHDIDFSPETFVNVTASTVSSPTLSISTISDLTPTEFDEETKHGEEQTAARHDTFYIEDGNVEIVCGGHHIPGSFPHPFVFLLQAPRHPFPANTPPCSNSRRAPSDHYFRQR
jgi:uncharacterized Zn-finger protein